MYKVVFSIFLAATALVLVSSHSSAYTAGGRHSASAELPDAIVHDSGTIRTSDLAPEGGRVAVTLWSSDNAASRLANAEMAMMARRDPGLTHVGINVDRSPAMFREILRRDRLDSDSLQLHVSGTEASKLMSAIGYSTVFSR